jgi:hypothetical protein
MRRNKAPKTNIQHPDKFQNPNLNTPIRSDVLEFDFWFLSGCWHLEFH